MVGAIGLGAMSFGGMFGPTRDDASMACLDAALAAGIDFWDTANIYGMGVSERVIGDYLAAHGPDVVLATKSGIVPGPPRSFNNAEDYIRAELDASLKRLRRDKVELYYVHRREAARPIEEVAETMARLIEEGLIDAYGLSEVAPATIRRAHAVHPVRAVQNEYSLWTRQPDLGVLRACTDLGIAFVAFSPLARGMLGDPPVDPAGMHDGDWRRTNPRFVAPNYAANLAAINGFRDWARGKGWTTAAAALAWVLDRGPNVIPIPGTRSAAHLADWLGADAIALTDADRAEIDALLPPGFAHGDRYSDEQMTAVERYC
ncbi:aldo/keto reductase [Meridianimarinicoccus roseus]|jgi:aryl-alcohol dehydrogenase-like predicted oxidoreductase